ncbi:MAG: hypothetical protein H7Y43_14075 [Akkermansiaceae bacterium]|nr:hypothetical protein [Verrucomicrobiales bacterium]
MNFIRICLVAVSCVAAPFTISASEPILNLAMLKTDSTERRIVFRESPRVILKEIKPALAIEPPRLKLRLAPTTDDTSLKTMSLEKRATPEARNPLKLSRRAARENSEARLWASASIQAGYGMIYTDKTPGLYGHNGTGWEEPGCGYVKIHFRF